LNIIIIISKMLQNCNPKKVFIKNKS